MHKLLLANRLGRWLAATAFGLLAAPVAQAQLAGPKTIPGDYATVAAAITALNAQGVGAGGVTFNIAAGYTETFASPTAGAITATGTAANPIVFQKTGSGANPVLTAGVGTSTTVDAIIGLAGSDYVTFDGLSVAENAANTTATTQAEFGFALFRASATDGAQNNTIRNCVVTLSKTNTGTIGIYGAPSTSASSTAVTATATAGANSSNRVYGNVVTNSLVGIYFAAGSATTLANYDQNNEIGSVVSPATTATGNTIGNFGGAASGYGAGGTYQNGLKIQGNTLNNTLNYTSATASTAVAASTVTSTLRGIYTPVGAGTLDILNNALTLASGATTSQLSGIENAMAGTTVTLTGNALSMAYPTATSATVYGYYNSASPTTIVISNNTLTNTSLPTTGGVYLIYNNHSATTATVANNQFSGFTRTGASGATYGYYNNGSGTGTQSLTNNTFNNFTLAGSGTFYGLYNTSSSSETQTWSGNQFTNIASSGTGTLYGLYDTYGSSTSAFFNNTITGVSGGSTVYGIFLSNSGLAQAAAYSNTVGGLSSSGASATVYGIYTSSVTTPSVYRNKVYDLSASGATATVYGLYNTSGTTVTYYNNLVGDLRATASTNLNAVTGLYISSGTTVNAYYNTINLNASSTGATFGTSGIYFTSTPTTVDLRNNIVVNKSTAAGTGGYTAALRRSTGTAGTVPANLATTTNNNLYYAGTPSATNLIYVEGTTTATNAQQTLAAYKTFLVNREQVSVTEDVPFLSTTGTAATFLHINPSVATQAEGAGTPVSGITTDFDNDTRNASTPDIGADEGTFMPQDLTGPSIAFTALANTSSTGNRTLTATITDVSGISTSAPPRIFYRKGTSGAFASALATSTSGSTYTFTINAAALGGLAAGDVVQYYVVAQDALGNVSSNPGGGTFTTLPSGAYQYTILSALSGVYYVGSGTSPDPTRTYATLTAAAAAYNTSGLGGAVTFLLLDATYSTAETFPVAFSNNPEASATNTLTIRPNTGVTTTITSAASGLAFINARYIAVDGSNVAGGTTRNLTVTSTSTTAGAYGIGLLSTVNTGPGNQFVTVRNTNVVSGSNTVATYGIYVGNGPDNDNITLTNNSVQGSYYGIYAFGSTTTSAGGMDNFVVSNNVVGPATAAAATNIGLWGIFVSNAVAASITGNEVQNVIGANTNNLYGIYLVDTKNAVVSRNSVHNLSYTGSSTYKVWAINSQQTNLTTAATPSAVRLDNNLVYNINSTTVSSTWNTVGINLGGGYGDQIVYNTVYLSGQLSAAGGTAGSAAFANGNPSVINTSTNIDVRNNIFAIIGGTGGTTTTPLYAHYEQGTTVAGSTLNYNDLYVTVGATGAAVIGRLNSTDYATLAAWQTATGQEANSVSVDPQFVQTTTVPYNLTPANIALNNAGTPIAGVTVDYAGTTRGTVPDIGAYEFTPLTNDLAANGLVAPAPATTGTCYGTAEPVSVSIRNAGSAALNFATNTATITVVVTLPDGSTRTFSTPLTSGTLASGATQTVTLPGTLNMSTVGTYSFAITATVTGDGNTTNDLLTPSPTRTVAAPVAGTLAPASSTICVSGTATLTLTGAANGAIQYQSSTDNVTFTDIAGATGAAYTTPVLTSTTYFRAQVRCSSGTATSNVSTITVNNPLVASTNTPVSICAGSTATLTATASTGATVRFFSAATGGTALATSTPGSYTTPALTASTTYYAEAYTGGTEATGMLAPNASDGSTIFTQSGVLFTVAASSATLVSTTIYPVGTGTINIALYDNTGAQVTIGGVALETGNVSVTGTGVSTPVVVPLNFANIPAGNNYRLLVKAYSGITGLVRGTASASNYSTPSGSVTTVNGTLTPPGISTSYYFFYNLQFNNECVGGAARTAIAVNVTQPATASFPAATASTCGTSAFALTGTVGGTATTGTYTTSGTGTFAPNATTLTATYTPSAADVAAGTVTITLTSAAAGPCAAATATQTLSISPAPVASFSYPAATTYCAGSTGTVSPALGTGATAGTFSSTAGLTLDAATGAVALASSTAGTYTVTNTVAASGACAAVSATTTVTITPATSAAFAYATGTFCASGTNPTPTVTGTAGGTFSAPAGLSLNASTGAINLSASTVGTYTVTYTVAGACGSSATASVAITAGQLATFSYGTASTYCVSGTANPAVVLGTGATAGTFSSTAGLTLNAATGALTLSTSTPGTYTVTNTVAASGGCAAVTATTQVTITAAPLATFGYATSAGCAGSTGTATPTPGTGATAGTFSSTAGLALNAATGAITLSSSAPGTYTVTNTLAAAGGCAAATATATFTVNPRPATPVITATYNGSTTTLTSSAATGNQFYLGPNPVAGATGQTLVLTGLPAQLGSYTVTATNANGCVSLPSAPLVVTAAKTRIAGASLKLYPNPTPTGAVTLELTGFRSATQLTVLDPLGRVVLTEVLPANAGTATHALDLTGKATGVYLLRLSNADGVETRRLVRE